MAYEFDWVKFMTCHHSCPINRFLHMIRYSLVLMALAVTSALSGVTIDVPAVSGDATLALRQAVDSANRAGGDVTIRLERADYHLSRDSAATHPYHISNTASAEENPDPTKHIGLWLRGLRNVTIDGCGATLVTHGEMTTFVVDSCSDVTLKNLTVTSADPSVPELTVVGRDSVSVTMRVTPPSQFEITPDGRFQFVGHGWTLSDEAIAQVFYPDRNVTLRCESPLRGHDSACRISDSEVMLRFNRAPDVKPGEVYQLRHGVRNEVCGFINRSRDVRLENINFQFMGNFGILGQYSENLTYDSIRCMPDPSSGRTNAGFADFVQMSGCRGMIRIANSHFEGAQDDPINIHGTHLQIVDSDNVGGMTVKFMHPQTFGFSPFEPGDSIVIVDRHTLQAVDCAKVTHVARIDDYCFRIVADGLRIPTGELIGHAVENITRTPQVEITGNYFARTPTRGILITTRGKSLIAGNTFFRIPMASVLVSDDARSWYESGPVRDLTIRDNRFVECASPAIVVKPETSCDVTEPVHSGIVVVGNSFVNMESPAVSISGAADVDVRDNRYQRTDAWR